MKSRDTGDDKLTALGISATQLADNLLQGVIVTDAQGNIEYVNATFCDVTGYTLEEVCGHNPRILQSGKQSPRYYRQMWRSIRSRGSWQGEIQNRKKNGVVYTEWLTIAELRDDKGRVAHYVAIFSDISKRKRNEAATWYKAHHDALTMLPNRSLFLAHLEHAIAQARRYKTILAVLFLDLDHLKEVNDALGHGAGDDLLKESAARIRSTVREKDMVARFGGDEFVVMLPGMRKHADIYSIAEKILTSLRAPYHLGTRPIPCTASMGISLFPENGSDADALIANADEAMYHAKREGRDRFQLSH